MSRRRNPLPTMSEGQVLKVAARLLEGQAKDIRASSEPWCRAEAVELLSAAASRLRHIARRVPLWTGAPVVIRRFLAWLVARLLPRPIACGRCGARKSHACWRVDCPRHEAAAAMGPLSALE